MNEKDKQIEQLFDEYASTLEPNERLADKARQSMRTNKGETKKRTWHAGLVAACAAVVATVLIIVPIFAVNIFSGGNNSSGGGTLAPEVHSYSISEIKANRVDADFAVDYLSTELPVGADIFSENYYACYIKQTGEFVYLKAVFGIEYNGGNIQMSVIAEKAGYAGSELAAEYKRLMSRSGYRYSLEYVMGEYVTMAYRKTAEYSYYVYAMGNVDGAQELAARIIAK